MDPDLVRQQEEAEREAMRLAGGKPRTPAPLAGAAALQAIAASSTQGAKPNFSPDAGLASHHTQPPQSSALGLATPIGVCERATPDMRPQAGRNTARSAPLYFSDFLYFSLAGAMLGGGLGIAAANYIQLPAEAAKLVIFGPAGFLALACALASFFTRKAAQPRASSGR